MASRGQPTWEIHISVDLGNLNVKYCLSENFALRVCVAQVVNNISKVGFSEPRLILVLLATLEKYNCVLFRNKNLPRESDGTEQH